MHDSSFRQCLWSRAELGFNPVYADEARVRFLSDDTLEAPEYKPQTMVPGFADLNDVVLPRERYYQEQLAWFLPGIARTPN